MSRRPRSHQVEDISVRRFEARLPPAWVSRAVSPDYGVDREVEIFTEDGHATGLKLAVQLKATDRSEDANRVALKVKLLGYLLNYDLPAIVVRFDASLDVLRWQWASEINARASLKPDQRTFTHRFEVDDVWGEHTPAQIERSLEARRALRQFPLMQAMPVRLEIDTSISGLAYTIERAVRAIVLGSGRTLVSADPERAAVELNIRVRDRSVRVDLDMLSGVTFDLDSSDTALLSSAILYSMAFLFAGYKLSVHARAAGCAILAGNHLASDEEQFMRAALAFADAPLELSKMAILNGMHEGRSSNLPIILVKLLAAERLSDQKDALNHFYTAALEAAQGEPSRAAAIHYSIANALRVVNHRRAVFHYNRARHLRPNYLQADYFLAELAGTLFHAQRYRCAVEYYTRAMALAPNHDLQLRLGDALLFSGEVAKAATQFELASTSAIEDDGVEANVKLALCQQLAASFGARIPADWSRPMGDVPIHAGGLEAWKDQISSVNALDPLANFNLGVNSSNLGDYDLALEHFLAVAVVQTGDAESWANAVLSAMNCDEALMATAILSLAVQFAGLQAHDLLRERLVSNGIDLGLIAELDEIALKTDSRSAANKRNGIILRMI